MASISLTNGGETIVDSEDLALLQQFEWLRISGRYVGRYVAGKAVLMHRFLLNASADQEVDHKDGNGFDNRRSNLRRCTHAENMRNRRTDTPHSSRFKGVHWEGRKNRWRSYINIGKRKVGSRYFRDEVEAAKHYDQLARANYGEFARLNFS